MVIINSSIYYSHDARMAEKFSHSKGQKIDLECLKIQSPIFT